MENLQQKKSELSKPLRISEADNDKLKEVLRYIFLLIGVPENKIPKDLAKDVLIDFIKTYHSTLRLEEIKEAFGLAVAGKLDADLQLYDKMFSAELFGRVISLYKRYIANKNREPQLVQTEQKQKELLISPEASYKMFIAQLEEMKRIPYMWNWDKIFKHLETTKEISDTNEEKEMFVEAFKLKLKTETEDVKKFNDILDDSGFFKTLCRKERITNYLKSKYPNL